jgi:hypothetical protein
MVADGQALVEYAHRRNEDFAMRATRLFLIALFTWLPTSAVAEEPQWIVVTAPAYRDALKPLCEHRKAQHMRVSVVQTTDVLSKKEILAGDADKLREHVNKLCRDGKGPCYVLLIGMVEADKTDDAELRVLPALHGTKSRMKGQPSDNGYGCLDQELIPTVAVGRFPAHSVKEAEEMVAKTLAYETNDKPGDWKRKLTVLAGAPAFSPAVDKIIEEIALAKLDQLDPLWHGKAIYANAQSRFCLPADLLRNRAMEYVEEGQALTLYLGHSNAEGFAAGQERYMDREDWARVGIRQGPGVFATFGCLGCQLNDEDHQEGYGVAAMRNPRGPVAVIGSQGICFAAMVQLASDSLFQTFCGPKPPDRLGDAWLSLKEGVAKGKINSISYMLLDKADGDPRIPQATQRLEHLEMFLLLGDPALRLPSISADIKLTVDGTPQAGKSLTVKGEAPQRLAGAQVRVSIERPLSSEPADLQVLPSQPGEERAKGMLANHERANRFALATRDATIKDGRFEVQFDLPAKLPWPRLLLRAYAATDKEEGLGVKALSVPKPEKR